MRSLLFALLVTAIPTCVLARPVPVGPAAILYAPAPYEARVAAVLGDSVFMVAHGGSENVVLEFRRRPDGTWAYKRKLFTATGHYDGELIAITAEDNLLAVLFDTQLEIFERSGDNWVRGALIPPTEPIASTSLAIDAGRVLIGVTECSASSVLMAKNSTGTWAQIGRLDGETSSACRAGDRHGAGDLMGDLGVTYQFPFFDNSTIYWLRNTPPGSDFWNHFGTSSTGSTPTNNIPPFNSFLAMQDGYTFAGSTPAPYVFVHTADGGITNTQQRNLRALDGGMIATSSEVLARDGLVLVKQLIHAPKTETQVWHATSVLHVWQASGPDRFEHVAIARGRNEDNLYYPELSGRRLVASSRDVAGRQLIYLFELPASLATPAPRQEDFQDGDVSRWRPLLASRWAIAQSGHSRVYRQSNLAGDSGAILADTDWRDQAVQADVRPIAFDGPDRFVALVARYQDFNNYYYLSLRSNHVLRLRKKVNGVVTELVGATLGVTPGRSYRVRLEARGDEIMAEVDGTVRLAAFDTSLTHGSAGFRGYFSRYEIDNVLVTPLATNLYRTDSGALLPTKWQTRGGSWNFASLPIRQQSSRSEAFALIGEPTGDQIVTSGARIDSFSTSSTAGWVGVVARYVDHLNFYHLTLRSNNRVQLRKQVNGVVTVLTDRSFTVTPGREYQLRLDVVGNRLRAYVDSVLQVETTDSSLASGRAGLATNVATASYSSFKAWQP